MTGVSLIHIKAAILNQLLLLDLQDACMALVDDYSQVTSTLTHARTTLSKVNSLVFVFLELQHTELQVHHFRFFFLYSNFDRFNIRTWSQHTNSANCCEKSIF